MSEETNPEEHTIKRIRQVLEDVKKNPLTHRHSPELIAKYESFNEELKRITENSPYYIMGQQMEFINSYFRNDPFTQLMEQNPIYQMAQNIKVVQESISRLYGEVYGNFKQFSEMGWYLSNRVFDEIPLSELSRMFRPKNKQELIELLICEAEKMIPEMLQNCCNDFETRKPIFEEIKIAFDNGLYHSVIVLAYTQADGICNDIFGNGFFDTELIDPSLKRKAKKEPEDFQLSTWGKVKGMEWNHSISVVEQLEIKSNEITAFTKEGKFLEPEFRKTSFNRHLVLHGHSKEFGTKENAIRAICLLDFLHFIITEAVEIVKESE